MLVDLYYVQVSLKPLDLDNAKYIIKDQIRSNHIELDGAI